MSHPGMWHTASGETWPVQGLALGGSTPAEGRYLLSRDDKRHSRARTKILVPPSVGPSMLSEPARMGGRSGILARPVGDRAGRGGAHDRARVRARAKPRAWQRVRRRQKALGHGVALELPFQIPLNRGWNHKVTSLRTMAWSIFFSSAGQTAAWGRLVGRHRVLFRP